MREREILKQTLNRAEAADDDPQEVAILRDGIAHALDAEGSAPEFRPGAYVLATKYADGDPEDQWAVGFLVGLTPKSGYLCFDVVDSEGRRFRGNGFRRAETITAEEGRALLAYPSGSQQPIWDRLADIRCNPSTPTLDAEGEGLPATDALYGFAAWLTCREESVTLGANHDAAGAAELVSQFVTSQSLPELSDAYPGNLKPSPLPGQSGAKVDDKIGSLILTIRQAHTALVSEWDGPQPSMVDRAKSAADFLRNALIAAGYEADEFVPYATPRPGDDWTPHTPGDPMPCDGGATVQYQMRDGTTSRRPEKAKALDWRSLLGAEWEIIAWRYYAREDEE
jgi:hypothetical protein